MLTRNRLSACGLSGWALACLGLSSAQTSVADAPAHADAANAEPEIIVTAQRRSERLQDVPIAVNAVTSDALERVNITDPTDLRIAVPGLNATNGAGYLFVRLRGVGSTASGPGVENAIATYIDGVYIASQGGSLFSFNNIDRIEVLKGPQGTLFGRNATGGLVQLITKDPKQELGGEFSFGYANYNTVTTRGYVTGGLTDTVSSDISFYYTGQGEGWGTNLFDGKDVYRNYYDVGARSKTVFEPSGATKLTLTLDYADGKNSLFAARLLDGTVSSLGGGPVSYPGPRDVNVNHDPIIETKNGGISLKWDQDIGALKLSSITAYRSAAFFRQFDVDLTSIPFAWFSNHTQKDKQFSQEVQLLSKTTGLLTWIIGAYYFNASSSYTPLLFDLEALGLLDRIQSTTRTDSRSGYAQATYDFGAKTDLTLGGRYTSETRKLSGAEDLISAGGNMPVSSADDRRAVFNKFTFRASLDHHFTQDILGYVSFNRGFKSGGWNASVLTAKPFAPETLDAYEVGLKSQLFDRRVTLNLAGYYYDYTNIQISTFVNGPIVIINGPSARIDGVDADLTVRVSDGFALTADVQALDDRYNSSFPNCVIGTPQGGTPLVTGQCNGNQLPLISRLSSTITPEYRIDLGDSGSLTLNGSWYYNSGWYNNPDNVIRQRGFSVLGASARWTDRNAKIYLEAWGKNLNDSRSFGIQIDFQNGDHWTQYAAPRTFGVSVGVKF